jgi:light-regulated signal transduction histidine kinase (bacteriophytochrome)
MTVSFENRYRAKDGTYRWLNWSSVSFPERGLVYTAARDVTEQKRAEAAVQQQASDLAAVNQELEAFSYSVSHDLRAPLRHVTGFASMLQRSAGARLAESESRHLTVIVEAAARMGRLIDDLLAFSRMGRAAIDRETVSLDRVVGEVIRELQVGPVEHPVTWRVHPLPDVDGDPGMLRQAFVNLISNAVKYSAGRPAPTVEIGCLPATPGETVIYVRDNGVGFDMQYAHKLFGVFQRLHSSDDFEGTGIGLANVRRIVHRHGGRVWVEAAVDAGATFFLSLPVTGDSHP